MPLHEQPESMAHKGNDITSPGRILKSARESKGISLKEVADYTKILKLYLEGLEEENYEYLPSEVYVRGYLQSYARYLKINPEDILQHMPKDMFISEHIPPPFIEKKQSRHFHKKLQRNGARCIAIGTAITALGIVLILLTVFHQESTRLATLMAKVKSPFIRAIPGDLIERLIMPSIKARPNQPSKPSEANKSPQSGTQHAENDSAPPGIHPGSSTPVENQAILADTSVRTDEMITEKNNVSSPGAVMGQSGGNGSGERSQTKHEAPFFACPGQAPIQPVSSTGPLITEVTDVAGPRGIIIDRCSVCADVKNRNPQEERCVFSTSDGRVYTWMNIKNANPPIVMRHIYYFEGKKKEDIPLNINYPNMRTWSYKTISHPFWVGAWRVDIAMENGMVLKSINFQVSP